MEYHISIVETAESAARRRLGKPLPEIPMVYRAMRFNEPARFQAPHFGSARYVFNLESHFAERLENNEITAKFAYDTWHEIDPTLPNCRIVAIVLEDRR